MAEEKLEEKLWNLKDWIPVYGTMHLLNRRQNMPYDLQQAFKTDCYIWANGLYNVSIFLGLLRLYENI